MITKLCLKNFKSFSDLEFDLVNNGKTKNIIAIYGENGSGKTNIVDALKLLQLSLTTMDYSKRLNELRNIEDTQDISFQKLADLVLKYHFSFEEISEGTQRIGTENNTSIIVDFEINSKAGQYILEYDKTGKIIFESLKYIILERSGVHFEISYKDHLKINLNKTIFKNKIINNLEEEIKKFWGKHTFLSIINDYIKKINIDYSKTSIHFTFNEVRNEFSKLAIWTDELHGPYFEHSMLIQHLDKGEIELKYKDKLLKTEEIIHKYFSALYTDIKDVRYQVEEDENIIRYELMIHKNISGNLIAIPIGIESNGTKNLLELLTVFFWVVQGRICVVDEIDSGIHDILMSSVLNNLNENIKGQLIFTTHDTALLKELSPSSAYFLSADVFGYKKIYPGNYNEKKISTNNNMEKLYLEGFFGAVPDPLDIDFSELFDNDDLIEV